MTLEEYQTIIEEFGLSIPYRDSDCYAAYYKNAYSVCDYKKMGMVGFFDDGSIIFLLPSVRFPSIAALGCFNGKYSTVYNEAKQMLAEHLNKIKKQINQNKIEKIEQDFE